MANSSLRLAICPPVVMRSLQIMPMLQSNILFLNTVTHLHVETVHHKAGGYAESVHKAWECGSGGIL